MNTRHQTLTAATTRTSTQPRDIGRPNAAEWLLRVGRQVARCMRHAEAGDLSKASQELAVSEKLGALAILFAEAPDVLKLRALVEDWTGLRVLSEIRRYLASGALGS